MIKITSGPKMREFVVTFTVQLDFDEDEALDDLVACFHAYVHGPWPEALLPFLEETEELRWASCKRYLLDRLEASTAGRIKKQLAEERKAA